MSAGNGALEIIGRATGVLTTKSEPPAPPIQIVFVTGGEQARMNVVEAGPAGVEATALGEGEATWSFELDAGNSEQPQLPTDAGKEPEPEHI